MVGEVVSLVESTARSKGVTLTITVDAQPLVVSGDAVELDRLVGNLVSNAVKYTHAGGTVLVSATRRDGEVELTIAEVGASQALDQIYRISYDGSVADVDGFVAMGGQAEQIQSALGERWREGLSLSEALVLAVELLAPEANGTPAPGAPPPPPAELGPASLEVAVLDRQRPRRAFRRLAGTLLERLLSPGDPTSDVPPTDDARPGIHDTLTGNDEASTGARAEPPVVPPPTDS